MDLINIKHPEEATNFKIALFKGLGKDRGLFFPRALSKLENIEEIIELPLKERSAKILKHLIEDEISEQDLNKLIGNAFDFPCPLVEVREGYYCLELFHGPSLAFKDFGARFMAQAISHFSKDEKMTILTATSGDTGGAVAQAFYGLKDINVVILYPEGKISHIQKQIFSTLGDNIQAIAIDGDFDACQAMVKDAFEDQELRESINLNSANSINMARLLAQVCYYFEAVHQLPKEKRECCMTVPSGNFGNITAALIAKELGLSIKTVMAATNENDTVVRYINEGKWAPNKTVATLSNAMDVSNPSNWERVEEMMKRNPKLREDFKAHKVSEEETTETLKELKAIGYISEPHTAVAYKALKNIKSELSQVFLSTAHPVKFKESVDEILGEDIEIPQSVKDLLEKRCLAISMKNDFKTLREFLLK